MSKIFLRALSLSAVIASTSYATAAPIVYTVNIAAGPSGSVTGTFTTDGALGNISGANFTAWNIIISGNDQLGHTISESLTNLNSSVFSGSAFDGTLGIVGSVTGLVATSTQLTFDFSNPSPSFLLFQKTFGNGTSFFCTATTGSNLCHEGFGILPTNTDPDGTFAGQGSTTNGGSAPLGVTLLATAESAVPEPASWIMLCAGFGLIGATMRRQPKISARISFAS